MDMMTLAEIETWLRQEDPGNLAALWARADRARKETVGDAVHFRGLIEISSYCVRACWYCGLRAERKSLSRYRMSNDEILASAAKAKTLGCGTVVLQAGEDPYLKAERIADIVRRIKAETGLAVTLSLGEQSADTYRLWKTAGADRYLLRIETTDPDLIRRIHPGEPYGSRLDNILKLIQLDYEVGSGVMVGIPGQTYAMLARDLLWFQEMNLDMIGIGPYLPHPDTPLAVAEKVLNQVPNSELMTEKAVALTRILCPEANLPATTALATINKIQGRELALARGANVVMPNLTPVQYRRLYEIYPDKACISETDDAGFASLTTQIRALGRTVGTGPGSRCSRTA